MTQSCKIPLYFVLLDNLQLRSDIDLSQVGEDLTVQTQVSNEVSSDQELRSRLISIVESVWKIF